MSHQFVITPGNQLVISAGLPIPPKENFVFLTNIAGLDGAQEHTLAPGHVLRKATAAEIAIIKEILVEFNGRVAGRYFFPWELKRDEDGNMDTGPEEEWKYYVISFFGSNETVAHLEQAIALLGLDYKIGFTVINHRGNRGLICHTDRLFRALEENRMGERMVQATAAGIEQVSEVYQGLCSHDAEVLDVSRIANELLSLETLPQYSELRFLAHFSMLESLLTHKPKPSDPSDSITRQVKQKIKLLNNRWRPPIDYFGFPGVQPDRVWGAMYSYRSSLAHGDKPDFKRDLKCLVSAKNASDLLAATLKAVARYALIEPRLVLDLKDC